MPGITANLTHTAYAIWTEVPTKRRRSVNSMGGPMAIGRSAWLSSVIVEHIGWETRYNKLLTQKIDLENELAVCMKTLNNIQKRIHE